MFERLAAQGNVPAFPAATDVGAPTRLLAGWVDLHDTGCRADDPHHLALGAERPARDARPGGDVTLRHPVPVLAVVAHLGWYLGACLGARHGRGRHFRLTRVGDVGRRPADLRGGRLLGRDRDVALDVDSPAGQLGGQPSVLTFLSDRQGELALRHHDRRRLGLLVDANPHHLGRAQRIGDVDGRVLVPLDDVDLLATQLADDVLDAQAARPDARADGVDPFLTRVDRHLRSGPGLARDRLDLDGAVEDLWDLLLEEPPQHQSMGA